jgi:predicted O-methyltransferase YrrM
MLTPLQQRVAHNIHKYTKGRKYWSVSLKTGDFLHNLILKHSCRYGVECGSGVGYSTLWIATAMQKTRGKLIGFEFYPPKCEQANIFLKKARLGKTAEIICASAAKGIPHLAPGVDFVFLDARKCDYLKHFQLLEKKCKKGAVIVADNIISHAPDLKDYISYTRKKYPCEFVSIGSGLEITYF